MHSTVEEHMRFSIHPWSSRGFPFEAGPCSPLVISMTTNCSSALFLDSSSRPPLPLVATRKIPLSFAMPLPDLDYLLSALCYCHIKTWKGSSNVAFTHSADRAPKLDCWSRRLLARLFAHEWCPLAAFDSGFLYFALWQIEQMPQFIHLLFEILSY